MHCEGTSFDKNVRFTFAMFGVVFICLKMTAFHRTSRAHDHMITHCYIVAVVSRGLQTAFNAVRSTTCAIPSMKTFAFLDFLRTFRLSSLPRSPPADWCCWLPCFFFLCLGLKKRYFSQSQVLKVYILYFLGILQHWNAL